MQVINENVEKLVYEDLIRICTEHADWLSAPQFSELLAKYSEAEIGAEARNRLKQKLLDKYSDREPRKFVQIDCLGPNAEGSGFGMTVGFTHELMYGSPVRILISEEYDDPDVLAEMLEDAAKSVRKGVCEDHYLNKYAALTTPIF